MTEIRVEMLRDGEWKEISAWRNIDIVSSLDRGIKVTLDAGYIHPPYRIVRDGEVMYARET